MISIINRSCLGAFARFAINGGGVALVAVSIYYMCAVMFHMTPLYANCLAYAGQLALGYQVHRLHSFGRSAMHWSSMARYAVLSVAAFLLNALWVWLLTETWRLPVWSPIIPMVAVTPLMTFIVARHWVFRARPKGGFILH